MNDLHRDKFYKWFMANVRLVPLVMGGFNLFMAEIQFAIGNGWGLIVNIASGFFLIGIWFNKVLWARTFKMQDELIRYQFKILTEILEQARRRDADDNADWWKRKE